MPTSFKVKLRRNPNKSGLHGIIIQVIHDRRSTDLSLNQYVKKVEFDSKNQRVKQSHPRHAKLNKEISDKRKEIEDIVFELKQNGEPFDIKDISAAFRDQGTLETSKMKFREYLQSYITGNPENLSLSTLKYYRTTLNKWNELMPSIKLASLREKHLIQFRDKLNNSGISQNTLHKTFKPIKKLLAIAKNKGLIDVEPMSNLRIIQVKGERAYLTAKELKSLNGVKPENYSEDLAKDVFMFSCYTGLRIGDICTLMPENILIDGKCFRLKLVTKKSREPLEFNLNRHAIIILIKYLVRNRQFIFPMLDKLVTMSPKEVLQKTGSSNAYINKYLKLIVSRAGIKKNISMHSARHTFAVLSIELGADLYVLSKMLGHTSIQTTEIYAKMVDKRKDELTELWNYEKII